MQKTISHFRRTLSLSVKGFTIIELLIVIAIIALLTGIVMSSLSPAKSKSRDAKRISDIGQIQAALELYFDRCREYPATLDVTANNGGTCSAQSINLGTYISVIPTNVDGSAYTYVNDISENLTTGPDYILMVTLENPNDILNSDIDDVQAQAAFSSAAPACGINGSSEVEYCLGPK